MSPSETQQGAHLYYLWLFNRHKVFVREVAVESPTPLCSKELCARYDQMHEDLADEVWPVKIGWFEWSRTPRNATAP